MISDEQRFYSSKLQQEFGQNKTDLYQSDVMEVEQNENTQLPTSQNGQLKKLSILPWNLVKNTPQEGQEGYIQIIVNNNNDNLSTKSMRANKKQNKNNFKGQCIINEVNSFTIQRNMRTQQLFYVAGGYLIELNHKNDSIEANIFLHSKVVSSSKLFYNNSVLFEMGCSQIIYNYTPLVNILNSISSTKGNQIADRLLKIQSQTLLLKQTIERLFNDNERSHIENIVSQRKRYFQSIREQFIMNHTFEDGFFNVLSNNLNFDSKSVFLSDFSMSQPLISLLGTTSDEMINYVMRNSLFWMLTPNTREKVIFNQMRLFNRDLTTPFQIEIQDTEIQTIDKILIKTNFTATILPVVYPEELLFPQSVALANRQDYVIIINYQITPLILEQIIKQREQFISSMKEQDNYLWLELEEFILDNFEHYMQNYIFLEKYYNQKKEQSYQDISKFQEAASNYSKNKLEEKTCEFRFISNKAS